MKTRRYIPYILTILVFDFIYWLTMIIPNKTLYLGFGQDWREVIMNNKIPLHTEIFIFGLSFILLGINVLEIITTQKDKFIFRLTKTILTIILTYLSTALIHRILDIKIWNLFYSARGIPANIFSIATLTLTTSGLVILEVVKRVYLHWFDKSILNKYIPPWLKMEKTACNNTYTKSGR